MLVGSQPIHFAFSLYQKNAFKTFVQEILATNSVWKIYNFDIFFFTTFFERWAHFFKTKLKIQVLVLIYTNQQHCTKGVNIYFSNNLWPWF